MRLDPGGRDDGRGAVGIGVVQKWEVKQQAKTLAHNRPWIQPAIHLALHSSDVALWRLAKQTAIFPTEL